MPDYAVFFALPGARGLFSGNESEWVPGGSQVLLLNLATALARTGRVDVVLLEDRPIPGFDVAGVRVSVIQPLIKKGLPYFARAINERRRAETFASQARRKVLLQLNTEEPWVVAYAREAGVRVVYGINGDSLVDGGILHPEYILADVHAKMRAADLVTSQTEHQRQLAIDNLGIDSAVVGNAVTLPPRDSLAPYPEKGYVLWIARSHPLKRPWAFIELAKRFPEREFVMVHTPGVELLDRAMETEAAKLPNLRYIPGVSHDEALELYRGCSVFVSTSMTEAVPIVFMEAASNARPILSLTVNPDGVLSDGTFGMCAEDDLEVLVAQLASLLDDGDRMRRMGVAARDYAEKYWSIEALADRHLDAFDRLFESGARS